MKRRPLKPEGVRVVRFIHYANRFADGLYAKAGAINFGDG